MGDLEVLLVHRPEHDDWSLPKGKRKSRESDLDCALREVTEETGLVCDVGSELATSEYLTKNRRRKRVRYWAMEPVSGTFRVNDEVDAVEWLEASVAVGRLTNERDLAIVASLLAALTTSGT